MRLKIILFLFGCLTASFTFANNLPSPNPAQSSVDCELPAPSNFQTIEVGPTWASFTWISNAPFADHRIRVFKLNGTLVATEIVPAGSMIHTVNNLPPGTDLYATINAICKDGENSIYEAPPAYFGTPILDLLTEGYTPSNQSSSCTMTSVGQKCSFSLNPNIKTTFEVAKGNMTRQFTVAKSATSTHFWVAIEGGNFPNNRIWIKLDDTNDPIYEGGSLFSIKTNINGAVNTVITFDISQGMELGAPVGFLNAKTFTAEWSIRRLNTAAGFQGPNPADERTETAPQESVVQASYPVQNIRVSPNPFSETLELHFPATANSDVQCQLFNLNGQALLSKVFLNPQAQVHSLNTSALAPGFYLLRMETEGKTQTIKVVKTE